MLFLFCVLLVYFCVYFVITEVVSLRSCIVYVFNSLELIIRGVGGNFFAMHLLILNDRSSINFAVLLKKTICVLDDGFQCTFYSFARFIKIYW